MHVSHQGKCEEKSWSFSIHFCPRHMNLSLRHAMQLWCLSISKCFCAQKNLLWFLAQVYVVHHPFPLFFYHPPQVFLSWVNSEN